MTTWGVYAGMVFASVCVGAGCHDSAESEATSEAVWPTTGAYSITDSSRPDIVEGTAVIDEEGVVITYTRDDGARFEVIYAFALLDAPELPVRAAPDVRSQD